MTDRRGERDPLMLIEALTHPNVQAFLRMLRLGEGTAGEDGYRTLFGGNLFDSFADHPRQRITRVLGGVGGKPIKSSAAGAYQFLERTWDALVAQYGFQDFSPKNQDLAAVALMVGRAALADVKAGRLDAALVKCAAEWASLPGAPYGQPTVSLARVREEYARWGGRLVGQAADSTPAGVTEPTLARVEPTLARVTDSPESAHARAEHDPFDPLAQADIAPQLASLATSSRTFSPTLKEYTMAPFVLAALPALIELVPRLGKLFASDSPTAQRNVAAAEAVARIAKEAVGASNEQDLVERLAVDPQARDQVKAAIEAAWFSIDEVGGGIAAARQANAAAAQAARVTGATPFWHQPVFWVTAALMPLVYFVTYAVLSDGSRFSPEVQSMVISTILAGGLGAVTGYWLGTSFSSQRKTELLKSSQSAG